MAAPLSLNAKQPPIQSTAGAVPVLNEKGEVSMEKVKVKRYVSGKRPDYAPMESSDEEEEDFQFVKKPKDAEAEPEVPEELANDPRLKRLQNRLSEDHFPIYGISTYNISTNSFKKNPNPKTGNQKMAVLGFQITDLPAKLSNCL
ncbi:microfibrillar-associated protein 1-like [Rhincodon typus]|uniref:microfibrillar-associated protein 1-like n=1 Tax=Rhincodon typus TaxID=259920 RepID=UPI002030E48D|nr:microfibrillar-associated protein 1-like [Rhincodon typus]